MFSPENPAMIAGKRSIWRRTRSWPRCWMSTASNYGSGSGELAILDRVGGGDGFASGFFYGLLTGEEPQDAVTLGWAHGALLTTFPGDTTMATLEQVRRGRDLRWDRGEVT